MGEWTWLHVLFPLADIELMAGPIDVKAANVLVRTIRKLPDDENGTEQYEVRVAPHNVSPFKGGPWLHRFTRNELDDPGAVLYEFRAKLAEEISRARRGN